MREKKLGISLISINKVKLYKYGPKIKVPIDKIH